MSVRRRGAGFWGPTLVVAAGIAVLIGLGTWQRERLAWKEGLIATLQARLTAEPVPLPAAQAWAALSTTEEFRRVTVTVTFLHDKVALVYTSGSSLRRDVSGPGFKVFTPGRLADGTTVMVDRGFVPEDKREKSVHREGRGAGPVAVTGVLRWPETPGLFTPAADQAANLWFGRDAIAIAAAKGVGPVAPFYVEQEAPMPAGGYPRPGRLYPRLSNNHFGYMLTWYGLAGALLAVYGVWLWGHRRHGGRPGTAPAS